MPTSWNLRHLIVVVGCLALALGVSACGDGGGGDSDGPGSTRLHLKIGNVLPLGVGPSRRLGQAGDAASDLALEQINAAIEDSGADHTVEVSHRDAGADADTASRAAKSLTDEGAACLTGPWSSAAVEQTAGDVAIPDEVLEIAPVPATETVTELSDHDLVNSTALPVSIEGTALADAIERDLGGTDGRTVTVVSGSDDFANELTQDFTEEWQDRDGTINTRSDGSPDAILLAQDPSGLAELASTLSSSPGWDPAHAWGGDQLVIPLLPKQVGTNVIAGMRALAPGIPDEEEASSAFAREFRSVEPNSGKLQDFPAQQFDATVLCYLAAVAAGSTEGREMADELIDITAPGGEQFTWQQLPDAIQALEDGEDIDYIGASGPLDMDVHGNPTSGVFDVYRYAPNGLQVVGEVPVEKPNPATP